MADDLYSDDTPEQARRRENVRVAEGIVWMAGRPVHDVFFYELRERMIKGNLTTDEAIAFLTAQAKRAARMEREERVGQEQVRAEIMRRMQSAHPMPPEIGAALGANGLSDWGRREWWVSPNGWLASGQPPCDVWSTAPEAVRTAADET